MWMLPSINSQTLTEICVSFKKCVQDYFLQCKILTLWRLDGQISNKQANLKHFQLNLHAYKSIILTLNNAIFIGLFCVIFSQTVVGYR